MLILFTKTFTIAFVYPTKGNSRNASITTWSQIQHLYRLTNNIKALTKSLDNIELSEIQRYRGRSHYKCNGCLVEWQQAAGQDDAQRTVISITIAVPARSLGTWPTFQITQIYVVGLTAAVSPPRGLSLERSLHRVARPIPRSTDAQSLSIHPTKFIVILPTCTNKPLIHKLISRKVWINSS